MPLGYSCYGRIIGLGVLINQNYFKRDLIIIINNDLGYYKQLKLLLRVFPFSYDKMLWKAELKAGN